VSVERWQPEIAGGSYRLIVRVNYPGQTLFVKAVQTHREYDRKEWMKWA
jgi:mRNA-degrading endonuclease HigB of HigAB toxin-antitoxin module